jgi:Tfp pilus assembly protein PilF
MNTPSNSTPNLDRVFLWSILVIAGMTVVSHILGAVALTHSLWGAHLYAFFPRTVLVVASVLLVGLCTIVSVGWRTVVAWQPPEWRASVARPLFALALLVVAIGLWVLRSGNTYLGDGTVLINSIVDGQTFHPREPLTMIVQQFLYGVAGPLFDSGEIERVAWDTIALGSVVTGVLFFVVALMLSRELIRLRHSEPEERHTTVALSVVVALIFCSQGYVQLFFGYIENYAFYTLGIAAYLWLSLRFVRGCGPLLVPAVALLVCIAFHIAAVILVPSFAVLCVSAFATRPGWKRAIRDLLIVCALSVALHYSLSAWHGDYSFAGTLLEATGFAVTRHQERVSMFSVLHFRDFLNEQLLIGPLGVFLFLGAAAAVLVRKRCQGVTRIFLVIAALGYLGAGWLAGDSNLGYARDWDVWAPAGLVLTASGLGLFLSMGTGLRYTTPALLCALLVSVYHTAPWVAVNASAGRGLARLKTLPLGLGRTEVLVSQWYRSHGLNDERYEWLERAVVVNPANNNAHYLLGIYHSERGDMHAAADSFRRAAQLRSDKVLFRQKLADALIAVGKDEEAIAHLEFELERDPGNVGRWTLYGETLRKTGRIEQATVVFERMLVVYGRTLTEDPKNYRANLACGWLLYNLEQFEASLPFFSVAIEVRPDSDAAYCLMGYSLNQLGRSGEATEYFKRCVAINPDRPDRADIESWLIAPDD